MQPTAHNRPLSKQTANRAKKIWFPTVFLMGSMALFAALLVLLIAILEMSDMPLEITDSANAQINTWFFVSFRVFVWSLLAVVVLVIGLLALYLKKKTYEPAFRRVLRATAVAVFIASFGFLGISYALQNAFNANLLARSVEGITTVGPASALLPWEAWTCWVAILIVGFSVLLIAKVVENTAYYRAASEDIV